MRLESLFPSQKYAEKVEGEDILFLLKNNRHCNSSLLPYNLSNNYLERLYYEKRRNFREYSY
jgi:hypothetical protein